VSEPEHDTPQLPDPSLWPIGFAIGVACLLLGLVISWIVAAIGAILAVVFGFLWARGVTRDVREEVPDKEFFRPLEGAEIVRRGTDITLIGYNFSLQLCLEAAKRLEKDGISAEVVDLRALKPLDRETIRRSVEKTHRVLVAEEDEGPVGTGSEIIATVIEECFFALDAQPVRVHAADVPVPYAENLEKAAIPDVEDVYRGALKVMGKI